LHNIVNRQTNARHYISLAGIPIRTVLRYIMWCNTIVPDHMPNCIGNCLSVWVLYVGFVILSSAEVLLANLFYGCSNSVIPEMWIDGWYWFPSEYQLWIYLATNL